MPKTESVFETAQRLRDELESAFDRALAERDKELEGLFKEVRRVFRTYFEGRGDYR